MKYCKISKTILDESLEGGEEFEIEKLKKDMSKYWLMAESSNPQFVMVRSATCFVSSTICCLNAITLCAAFVSSFFNNRNTRKADFHRVEKNFYKDFGYFESDYGGCISLIVLGHTASIALGTLASVLRSINAVKIRCSTGRGRESGCGFSPEEYWTKRLIEWTERPLHLQIGGHYFMKAINKSKDILLWLFIKVQIVIVVICKLVLLSCVSFVRLLLSCFLEHSTESSHDPDVTPYILHLEGEDRLPLVTTKNKNVLRRFIQKGNNKQPEHLVKLLQNVTNNFYGVAKFDSRQVCSLHSGELPNCWKLPAITLTSIAIGLPQIHAKDIENLVYSVSAGLKYVDIVDEVLGTRNPIKKICNDAANVAWSGVNLSGKFLNTFREILPKLCGIAEDYIVKSGSLAKDCTRWPNKVIIANSMYRICQTVMLEHGSSDELSNHELFGQISVMIADILGACITNIPLAIMTKSSSITTEKREETVKNMAHVIGETEEVLKMLQEHQLPNLTPKERRIDIDEWRH